MVVLTPMVAVIRGGLHFVQLLVTPARIFEVGYMNRGCATFEMIRTLSIEARFNATAFNITEWAAIAAGRCIMYFT